MADNKKEEGYYVVKATAFGHKDQIISVPTDKLAADALADNIKDAMDKVTSDYKMFTDIKVVAHQADDFNDSSYINSDKKDPYNYSILDSLDKKIKGE